LPRTTVRALAATAALFSSPSALSGAERDMAASAELQMVRAGAPVNSPPDELTLCLQVPVINSLEWKST
jgi:hypothetical protein